MGKQDHGSRSGKVAPTKIKYFFLGGGYEGMSNTGEAEKKGVSNSFQMFFL